MGYEFGCGMSIVMCSVHLSRLDARNSPGCSWLTGLSLSILLSSSSIEDYPFWCRSARLAIPNIRWGMGGFVTRRCGFLPSSSGMLGWTVPLFFWFGRWRYRSSEPARELLAPSSDQHHPPVADWTPGAEGLRSEKARLGLWPAAFSIIPPRSNEWWPTSISPRFY